MEFGKLKIIIVIIEKYSTTGPPVLINLLFEFQKLSSIINFNVTEQVIPENSSSVGNPKCASSTQVGSGRERLKKTRYFYKEVTYLWLTHRCHLSEAAPVPVKCL